MAGKEAVVFLVDLHRSMAEKMELARKVMHVMMVQKMLQTKMNEVGVLLFGLPAEETNNRLNDEDNELYQGLQEFCRLEPGNVATLRRLKEVDVPDEEAGESHGDLLDAMIVGVDMIRQRTKLKKFSRHVYMLTDGATPVSDPQMLRNVVDMYLDSSVQCKFHFVGFGPEGAVKKEPGVDGKRSIVEEENEKMLASAAAATDGTVVLASTAVKVLGEAMIRQTNPFLAKVDFSIGTKLTVRCRYFKKIDCSSAETMKKESLVSKARTGAADDGKVRLDRIYRDPEMPEVEVDFKDQVKGYRYGQDYIPVNAIDEASMKLPKENPSLKALGFVPSSSVKRHLFMETLVVVPEPGSRQSSAAFTALVKAMRNQSQVAVVRFVRKAGLDPWVGVLMVDSTGVTSQERFLFQRLPFSEDLRDFTFPSFQKCPASRRPSEAQLRVSASLIDAMMIPEHPGERTSMRGALPLDPVRQGMLRLKVARAMDPECDVPPIPPSILAGVNPDPQLLEGATPVLEWYLKEFTFVKQGRTKVPKKRVTYFSDLALAEPETSTRTSLEKDAEDQQRSPKSQRRGRTDIPGRKADGDKDSVLEHADNKPKVLIAPPLEVKVGSIDPVGDFEKIILAARDADGDGADLAEHAVEQIRGVIHTLVKKGSTSAIRNKVMACIRALRRACVSHFMGQSYNDFLAQAKTKYEVGSQSDFWEAVRDEKDMWPITTKDDASLGMTPEAAAGFMRETTKQEKDESEDDDADDDGLDDLA